MASEQTPVNAPCAKDFTYEAILYLLKEYFSSICSYHSITTLTGLVWSRFPLFAITNSVKNFLNQRFSHSLYYIDSSLGQNQKHQKNRNCILVSKTVSSLGSSQFRV